jgi:hypothetical protein
MKWTNGHIKGIIADKPEALTFVGDIIRYVAGCIMRERERLARIIERESDPAKIAAAIRDSSEDVSIFAWKGPRSDQ